MIKRLCHHWLKTFSKRYQYDTGYMKELLERNLAAFLKYSSLNIVAAHRRGLPATVWFAARIRSALWEDCGGMMGI